ncbi:MAG: acyl carrier protein [Phycisphaerae bacterium]|jgi:acyl carrier protein|nr:acyl carrier protein [Phycisphaerae bacterium]
MNNVNDQLSNEIRRIASDVLGVPAGQLTDASSPESVESWDSVAHLSLVLALEQAGNVQFDPEDIEKMRSIGAIEAMVRGKRGG